MPSWIALQRVTCWRAHGMHQCALAECPCNVQINSAVVDDSRICSFYCYYKIVVSAPIINVQTFILCWEASRMVRGEGRNARVLVKLNKNKQTSRVRVLPWMAEACTCRSFPSFVCLFWPELRHESYSKHIFIGNMGETEPFDHSVDIRS